MASHDLEGILVALITPFTEDKKRIDTTALDEHVNRMIDAGVHGLVPGGSTGEFTVLSTDERKTLVEQCCKSAAGRVPVIAGVGDLSTERAVEMAVHAKQVGAAALMVVPPFYDPPALDQLRGLLNEIHQASELPLVYYNIPSSTGLHLSSEELAGLSNVGVKYMKDTSGNAPALTKLLFQHHNEITVFNGWDTLTFYGLAAGARGGVWGAANIIPELSMQLWDALAVKGNLKLGRDLWSKIYPICALLEEGNYAASVKTGMELRGWSTGGLRKPFDLLRGEQRTKLQNHMKRAGVF